MSTLDDQAAAILRANDRGGFTVPTARLYPYQWNWDSAFAALGFAELDLDRAWREVELLFQGQWPNGMVPHIIFRRDDPDYFPGPAVWRTGTTPPTSGHSQPPVAATVVRALYDKDPGLGEARARALAPKLAAWHRWFRDCRDPLGEGVAVTTHPWESGRDNSPDWDAALANVDASGVAPFTRRDTGHVNAAMRPTEAEYRRYIRLVEWGREAGWDHAKIAADGPFAVADPGLTFILTRAERDLAALAGALGLAEIGAEAAARADRLAAGAATLWSESLGGFVARDSRTGAPATGLSCTGFLSFYAGVAAPGGDERALGHLARFLDAAPFGVASFDPQDPRFDPIRYWRGPSWAVVNHMIGRGLAEQGHEALAGRVRAATSGAIERSGFYEYFDPVTGAGAGGGAFTWTAAVWLAWASPGKDD